MKRRGQGLTFGSQRGGDKRAVFSWWPWLGAGMCAVALVVVLSVEASDAEPPWVLFFVPAVVAGALIGRLDVLVLPLCAVAAFAAAGGSMSASDVVDASAFAGLIVGGMARAVLGRFREVLRR